MKLKQTAYLSSAVLAATLAMGIPATAVAQDANQPGISISVGHNVVDAVDDVRETTVDFIGALLSAEEGLGIANWEQQEQRLMKIEEQLEQMEMVLDKKAEATDEEWLDWLGGPEYSVMVSEQLTSLGSQLEQISGILEENWNTEGIQVLVGANVLEQLRDLRETTADLLNAMENADENYNGWTIKENQLEQAREKLETLSNDIDPLLVMSDAEWKAYLESDRYHVVIHDNVATLATIIKNLALSTKN